MKNGWTGGQYSLFRLTLAAYLFVHFVTLYSRGGELFSSSALLALAALATLPLAVGMFDRPAAIFICCLWAFLFGRNPLTASQSLPIVGLLIAHALLPAAPYGSWKARGRSDPAGDWAMPETVFLASWIVMALGYSYGGVTKLVSPTFVDGIALGLPPILLRIATWSALALELLFAPLALSRRLRPWIWLGMVGVQLGVLLLVDSADLACGMLLVHFFTFDPDWIPGRTAAGEETLFYDGTCALCHRAVRFALAEDRSRGIRFAPLQGEAFKERIPDGSRLELPDSLVVLTGDGAVLSRSAAVLHLLSRMGGLWRLLAGIARVVPAPIRDVAYDALARIRYRVFGKRTDLCPIIPPGSRSRFDLR
jgi:predicted DCC family thiol-disulfide oxidoreductase YuxK